MKKRRQGKIKPCPFCGKLPDDIAVTVELEWAIHCPHEDCRASGPIKGTEEKAKKAWQRRPKK